MLKNINKLNYKNIKGSEEMLNFTVGPVQSSEEVRQIGYEQVPYFRTPEFSKLMLENERLIKKFAKADDNSRALFITGSGTASMEACIVNLLTEKDKILIINGGSFGQRFVDLCQIYHFNYEQIKLNAGKKVTRKALEQFKNQRFTTLLVNYHETSTGQLYDIKMISEFCLENNLFLIVDTISSFLADEFDMKDLKVDAMITGSQKALACAPGVSVVVLSERAIKRVNDIPTKCMYLDFKSALKNGERGQTPFTPAVGILRQINVRLKQIEKDGGVLASIENTRRLAEYFRNAIKDLPLKIVPDNSSNAVTALCPLKENAYEIFEILKDQYNIWICPNGGELKNKIFRVGHIGYLNESDYDELILALNQLHKNGVL